VLTQFAQRVLWQIWPYPKARMLRQLANKALPRVCGRLRAMRAEWEIGQLKTYKPREVRHRYGGVELRVWLADPQSAAWYDQDWVDLEAELKLLAQHRLKSGATVFNLGSHQSIVALAMENMVRPGGRVVAVDASRHNSEAARQNALLNSAEGLIVVHGAVAAKSGTLMFSKGFTGTVDDGIRVMSLEEVDAYSIDDLSARYGTPDVLFIDVEGYECEALAGATKTLQSFPDCFVEVHVNGRLETFGGSVSRVLSYFPQSHYKLFVRKPEKRMSSCGSYAELTPNTPLVKNYFYLTAIAS